MNEMTVSKFFHLECFQYWTQLMHINQNALEYWLESAQFAQPKSEQLPLINDSETTRRVMLLIASISWNEFFFRFSFLFFIVVVIRISFCISIKTCVVSCCSMQWSNVTKLILFRIFRSRTVACGAGCSRGDKLFGAFRMLMLTIWDSSSDVTRAQTSTEWIRGNKQLSTSFSKLSNVELRWKGRRTNEFPYLGK